MKLLDKWALHRVSRMVARFRKQDKIPNLDGVTPEMQRVAWLSQNAEAIAELQAHGLEKLWAMLQENAFQYMRRAASEKDHDEIIRLNARVAVLLEIPNSVNAVLKAVRQRKENQNG
jgi:hypothetical protein